MTIKDWTEEWRQANLADYERNEKDPEWIKKNKERARKFEEAVRKRIKEREDAKK